MPRKKLDDKLQEHFGGLLDKLNPLDAAIFMAGAISGYNGMTPTTAMFNVGKGLESAIGAVQTGLQKVMSNPLSHPEAIPLSLSPALFFGYLYSQGQSTTTSSQTSAVDSYRISMAMIGGIEAIMITRPGFAPAMLQFAGDTLGTLKGIGGQALAATL